MRPPEHYVIPIDKDVVNNVDDICTALRQTKELSYESHEDIREAVLIALMEYLIDSDWTGIEVLMEFGKADLDDVSYHLLRNLMYRLSDASVYVYPRLCEGARSLKDIVKYYRDPFFITHVYMEERSNTLLVEIMFDLI